MKSTTFDFSDQKILTREQILKEKKDLKNKLRHPAEFDIYKPHMIIDADRSEISDLYALKVYNFFIAQNHVTDDTLRYSLPYSYFGSSVEQRNLYRDFNRLSEKLTSITIYIDPDKLERYFPDWEGKQAKARFSFFPSVVADHDSKILLFEVNPRIKEIFRQIRTIGFVKGDFNLLDGLNVPMNNLYWVLRKLQKIKKVHDIDLEDLRDKLHLGNKYKEWKNFKRIYLNAGEETFKSDWVSFKWTVAKKTGRGGTVKSIRIAFKRGPEEERNSPVGHGESWEKVLLKMGFKDHSILKFRELIALRKCDYGKYCNKEFHWTNSYILYSLEAARKEWETKYRNKPNLINDLAGWMYDSLINGKYIDYVEKQPLNMSDL